MVSQEEIKQLWLQTRARLTAKGLADQPEATLSLRCPSGTSMWFGATTLPEPHLLDWRQPEQTRPARIHAAAHAARGDAGAVLWGGGPFSACLGDFGGVLPQVFDEQARHIGPMSAPISRPELLAGALRRGGNVVLWQGLPLCIGVTATRLALNAELLEKCAKAYVLAAASGGRVNPLPWLVRHIANGRLIKDERRAALAFQRGALPEESKAY
ncbi:hypothetical protein FHW83_003346 [Duganella sp. SG902]|uniref:hypothetical protein n=1 Tax=Duganella sp. SG902 TaxID=2587016 RepID=UPI00159DC6CA|nr:hypothetical protein [Duganella sp. SG902]NVM77528.1 hypothetical protein [Duganella sp. SG902]